MILIFDFGSQTCHLIGRRLRDLGIKVEIVDPENALEEIKKFKPAGIIFSGGPANISEENVLIIDKRIFGLGVPVLGICYGWQLIAHLLGGRVAASYREYGPAKLDLGFKIDDLRIIKKLPKSSAVWLSHGDTVVKLPKGFEIIGSTKDVRSAFVANFAKKIFGVQFHPEVEHTQFGTQILKNFAKEICGLPIKKRIIRIEEIIKKIKLQVGQAKVVGAVSGGVDSTTTAVLITKAIGKNFTPIYIENGLMRQGTKEEMREIFEKRLKIKPIVVQAKKIFMQKLKSIVDPEEKRKIIGNLYIKCFEEEAKKIKGVKFLAQGTIYSDVIESQGTKKASKIKSHHNVGGLPEEMKLKLIEPLRYFYKDEVRFIAKKLGLPSKIVYKQVFPGPGQAIRIIGEVTEERLAKQHKADKIVLEEIIKAGLYKKVYMSFPILTGIKSTAVKGDARKLLEVVAVRVIESKDIMTTDWSKLPYDLLQKISSRIVNEVLGISRVVYDITTKPPATMEWE